MTDVDGSSPRPDDSPSIPTTSPGSVPVAKSSGSSSRRRWLGIAAIALTAALAGAAVTALGLSAASGVGANPSTPAATASPNPIALVEPFTATVPEPNPALTADSLEGAASWAGTAGFDLGSLQGYQAVGSVTPWTATRFGGLEDCVLLAAGGGIFRNFACAQAGRTATLGIPAAVESADGSLHQAILLFMGTGTGVEVRSVPQ